MLCELNEQLTRTYTRGGTFVTAFYAILDPSKRTLTYSRAGHNPPRLVRGDRVISLEENGAMPMGIADDLSYEESRIQLERGDLLLLYTDGITEAPSATNRTELVSGAAGSGLEASAKRAAPSATARKPKDSAVRRGASLDAPDVCATSRTGGSSAFAPGASADKKDPPLRTSAIRR